MTRRLAASAVLALAMIAVAVLAPVAGAATQVNAFPSPGSHFASPGAAIAFRGEPAGKLGTITVTGSESGVHAGKLVAHSDGDGASFVPDKPFKAGETVTVKTDLSIRGAKNGDFELGIITPGPALPHNPIRETPSNSNEIQHFDSQSFTPPWFKITMHKRNTVAGDIFAAPKIGPGQHGPMIFDHDGNLIWFHPLEVGNEADDFRVQKLDGKRVLTFWEGFDNFGTGNGVCRIFNAHYKQIRAVGAANGYAGLDPHECELTGDGTMVGVVEAPVADYNLARFGSKTDKYKNALADAVVWDSVVQEIDLKTGLAIYEWHSLDHVPVTDAYIAPPKTDKDPPFDYFHINSVQKLKGGDFLVSGRNTWAVYRVNGDSGRIEWQIGGKDGDFKRSKGAFFAFQHDARLRPHNTLTLFDNGGMPFVHKQSVGRVIKLDQRHKTAKPIMQLRHDPPIQAGSQGNVQPLNRGHWFVGYGQIPTVSEFDSKGRMIFNAHFPGRDPKAFPPKGVMSYRAYRIKWRSAKPVERPALAVEPSSKGGLHVAMSWNGATGYRRWRILGGDDPDHLKQIKMVDRSGFETDVRLRKSHPYIAAQPLLRKSDRVLATTAAVPVAAGG